MALILRFIVVALLAFPALSNASIPKVSGWRVDHPGSAIKSTKEEACQNFASIWGSGPAKVSKFEIVNGQCRVYYNNGVEQTVDKNIYQIGSVCPSNSSDNGSSCTCNSGFSEDNGQCVAEISSEKACGAAFYNSNAFADGSNLVVLEGHISDGVYCQPQGDSIKPGLACAMNFERLGSWKSDDGKWHSQGTLSPRMIGSNFQPCVPGIDPENAPMDPKKPPELPKKQDPKCPNGYKGDVGGKEACIPSYGYNGVDFAPKTKYSENDKTRTETTTKTECAEGKCTTTVTEKVTDKATGQSTTTSSSTTEQDRDWCAKPKNKDQCAANGKPAYSGQGTGVSGGGSGSGNGNGNGDGDDQGGKCGAKNQPPCKIDEQGTPDGKNAFDDAKGQLDRDHQSKLDTLGKIQSAGDKNTSLGFDGGFAWLTHRTCMPWNFGALEIYGRSFQIEVNVCPIESIISPVMNFLWILGTLFATIYRVSAVMGAKVE